MHNYMLPKLCTSRMSLPKAALSSSCYVHNNDFSPPAISVTSKVKFAFLMKYFNENILNCYAICKNYVKELVHFKLVNHSPYLYNSAIDLKRDFKGSNGSYLAPKGHYLTNSTILNIQTIAYGPFYINSAFRHSNFTIQKQLHLENITLFSNCVAGKTGRLDIRISRKDQSKKSNPRKQDRII